MIVRKGQRTNDLNVRIGKIKNTKTKSYKPS